jgi:penicillin-binding protein 1A
MAGALKTRPNLKFVAPPGVTVASWDSGYGTVTDAFKTGQVPGASQALGGGGTADADAGTDTGGAGASGSVASGTPAPTAGVDSGMGGLY